MIVSRFDINRYNFVTGLDIHIDQNDDKCDQMKIMLKVKRNILKW